MCMNPKVMRSTMRAVFGSDAPAWRGETCEQTRSNGYLGNGKCGPHGVLFEPRGDVPLPPPPPPDTLLIKGGSRGPTLRDRISFFIRDLIDGPL